MADEEADQVADEEVAKNHLCRCVSILSTYPGQQSVLSRSVSYSIGHTFHSVAVDPGRVADKVVEEVANPELF